MRPREARNDTDAVGPGAHTFLFAPAANGDKVAKALRSQADVLEDSVSENDKVRARRGTLVRSESFGAYKWHVVPSF
jgi:citrate lyase beta subunit